MDRFKGMWRDTRYVWAVCLVAILVFVLFGSWFHLALIPILPVCFCYFAFVRYDEHGNVKADFK